MKNTNTNEFKNLVWRYLAAASYDDYQPETLEGAARYLFDRFNSEYNHPANVRLYPNTQQRVAEWLAGLPLNVACYYSDIIATAEAWHGCKISGKLADRIIENWFSFLALKLIQLWAKYDIS